MQLVLVALAVFAVQVTLAVQVVLVALAVQVVLAVQLVLVALAAQVELRLRSLSLRETSIISPLAMSLG